MGSRTNSLEPLPSPLVGGATGEMGSFDELLCAPSEDGEGDAPLPGAPGKGEVAANPSQDTTADMRPASAGSSEGTASVSSVATGGKRPASAASSEGTFKVPMSPSKRPARPPLLVVDTTAIEDNESPSVPRTPANVRMNNPTELHNAVIAGNVAAARTLLEEGHVIDPVEEHGFSPLHKVSSLSMAAGAPTHPPRTSLPT